MMNRRTAVIFLATVGLCQASFIPLGDVSENFRLATDSASQLAGQAVEGATDTFDSFLGLFDADEEITFSEDDEIKELFEDFDGPNFNPNSPRVFVPKGGLSDFDLLQATVNGEDTTPFFESQESVFEPRGFLQDVVVRQPKTGLQEDVVAVDPELVVQDAEEELVLPVETDGVVDVTPMDFDDEELVPDFRAMDVVEDTPQVVADDFEVDAPVVSSVVEDMVDSVPDVVDSVVEDVNESVPEVVAKTVEPVEDVTESVAQEVSELVAKTVEPVEDVNESVHEVVAKTVEPVEDVTESLAQEVSELVAKTVEPVEDVTESVAQEVSELVAETVVPEEDVVETVQQDIAELESKSVVVEQASEDVVESVEEVEPADAVEETVQSSKESLVEAQAREDAEFMARLNADRLKSFVEDLEAAEDSEDAAIDRSDNSPDIFEEESTGLFSFLFA